MFFALFKQLNLIMSFPDVQNKGTVCFANRVNMCGGSIINKIIKTMLFIILILFQQGCFNNEQVTEELIEYHNNGWRMLENMKEKGKTITSEYIALALEDNNKDIEGLVKKELLPLLKEMVEHLETIQLETKEVKKLNQLEIEAQRFVYDNFKGYANILQNGNAGEIDAMYEQFDDYNKELERKYAEVEDEREKLMEKYDVELISDYDKDGNRVMKMVRKKEN